MFKLSLFTSAEALRRATALRSDHDNICSHILAMSMRFRPIKINQFFSVVLCKPVSSDRSPVVPSRPSKKISTLSRFPFYLMCD